MIRRISLLVLLIAAALTWTLSVSSDCQAQQAFGRSWNAERPVYDWDRFYHYPYVYYPQNFWTNQYYRSSNSLYYRYPPEMRIPVYNKKWHNYYPAGRKYLNRRTCLPQKGLRYHSGHHFVLDVF